MLKTITYNCFKTLKPISLTLKGTIIRININKYCHTKRNLFTTEKRVFLIYFDKNVMKPFLFRQPQTSLELCRLLPAYL